MAILNNLVIKIKYNLSGILNICYKNKYNINGILNLDVYYIKYNI